MGRYVFNITVCHMPEVIRRLVPFFLSFSVRSINNIKVIRDIIEKIDIPDSCQYNLYTLFCYIPIPWVPKNGHFKCKKGCMHDSTSEQLL